MVVVMVVVPVVEVGGEGGGGKKGSLSPSEYLISSSHPASPRSVLLPLLLVVLVVPVVEVVGGGGDGKRGSSVHLNVKCLFVSLHLLVPCCCRPWC